ncbi:MAG: ABC transporter permease [Pyrinomonadaceae bacterium]
MSNMVAIEKARGAVWRPLRELPRRLNLVGALARRELATRYRGSSLGFLWAVIAPVVMIAIYTFIFAGIFGARFGREGSNWDYALYVFCGLLPWAAFAESLQASSTTVITHANLVKRVVFPLEVLPVSHALAGVGNQLFGTLALLAATLVLRGRVSITLLWLPVLLFLQLILTFGLSWLVASLGVFLRDTREAVSLALTAWMFLTPLLYPEGIVPERYRKLIEYNPWTPLVRSYRRVLLENSNPDWRGLLFFFFFALALFVVGYWWFARTRRNFADVI